MNTLNKQITRRFFLSENGYDQLRARWSELVNSDEKHNLSAAHHALYAMLRGKDWRKGFTTPKRVDPSWEGASPVAVYNVLPRICASQTTCIFDDILAPDAWKELRALIPSASDAYRTNVFETDAYKAPVEAVA